MERVIVENVLGIYVYHRGATLVVGPNIQNAFLDSYGNVLLDPISLTGYAELKRRVWCHVR
jgi:hypothetical protein